MSDPLSLTASIIAVLQLASTATQYIKDVKHGSTDRTKLRDEMRNAIHLFEMLQDRIEDAEDSDDESLKLTLSRSLAGPDSLLESFKKLTEDIIAKLAPQDRLRRLSKHFIWPFEKKDVAEMLDALERLKTYIGLLLQNDVLYANNTRSGEQKSVANPSIEHFQN